MIVRLDGKDIAEAIVEHLTSRGMQVGKGKIEVRVHLKREGWVRGELEALVFDVPIEKPALKQGPYR